MLKRFIQNDKSITFVFFSIARKDFGKQVKAQTKEFCGGPLVKLVFLFSWGHGKCDISKASLKLRNLCDFKTRQWTFILNISSAIVLMH